MRPKVFFPLVIMLYLASPYFFYHYISLNAAREDKDRVESGMMPQQGTQDTYTNAAETDILDQQEKDLTLQSYGYLGGAIFTILCPTLLLLFRHRILT